MLYILNKQEQIISTLSNKGNMNKVVPYFEDIHIEELDTGVETFEFKTISNSNASNSIQVGNYVAFKDKEHYKIFQIREVKEIHAEQVEKTVYCESACLELLNEVVRPMEINSANLNQFLNTILDGTSWSIGMLDAGLNEVIPVDLSNYDNVYKVIQDVVIGEFGGEIRFRVEIANNRIIAKYIDVFAKRGKVTKHRFEYGVNMTSVEKIVDSSELVTALIGIGKDNITFKEVESDDKPKNQDFIINEDAYNRWNNKGSHIMGVFNYESESPQELLRLTREELKRRSNPKITYNLDVELLGEDVDLGDEVFVIDNEFNPPLYLSARVNKLERSKTDSQINRCTLANFKEVKSSITSDMRALADSLEGKVDDKINQKFPIGNDDIQNDAITSDKVGENQIYGSHIFANQITADHIDADQIKTKHIDADAIKSKHIDADQIKSDHIDANQITSKHLSSDSIKAEHIDANQITAKHLSANSILAGSTVIGQGAIGSAQISELSADKVSSGTIDTSNLNIQGADGMLKLRGNRLQVFAGTGNEKFERVSLGDVHNDGSYYGLLVRGTDGNTVLFDEKGITEKGITDGLITNEHISGETQIDGAKLNISSVVREINDNTEKISGTSIDIEGTTLSTKLSTIETTQTEDSKKIENNTASIKANEKSINLKVDSQTYTNDKENMTSQLNKNTSAISVLQDGIKLKVEQTDITNAIKDIEIGGRNLLKNSDFSKNLDFWGGASTEVVLDTTKVLEGRNSVKSSLKGNVTNVWKGITQQYSIAKENDLFTASVFTLSEDIGSIDAGCAMEIRYYNSSNARITQSSVQIKPSINNVWEKFELTGKCPIGTVKVEFIVYVTKNGTAWFNGCKLETGNKATDWTPSPNDTTTEISNIRNELSLGLDGIKTEVSQSYYSKNDIDSKGYQTSSQVEQKVDEVKVKFENSGGYNLIRNSSGLNGINNWTTNANMGTGINNSIGTGTFLYLDNGTTASERYAYSSRFKLIGGRKYTLSGLFNNNKMCSSFDVHVLSSTSVDETKHTDITYTNANALITSHNTNEQWKKLEVTFTAPSSVISGYIRIDNNGYDSVGTNSNRVHWSALLLEEGELSSSWAPHPNEVYDGITTIDKDGITIANSNSDTYTQIDSSSFSVNNNNGGTIADFSRNSVIPNLKSSTIISESVVANNVASINFEKNDVLYTWYVDSTSGDDANDGSSTSSAFKTLQQALDNLPTVLTRYQTIKVKGYQSGANLRTLHGHGVLSIEFEDNMVMNGMLYITGVTTRLRITCTTAGKPTIKGGLTLQGCSNVDVYGLNLHGLNTNDTGCVIDIKDCNYIALNSLDFVPLSDGSIIPCGIKVTSSTVWTYNLIGSKIRDVIGIYPFSLCLTAKSGTIRVPDSTNGYYISYDGGYRFQTIGGADMVKTSSKGYAPGYVPTQKTRTWNFNNVYSTENLNGWGTKNELIQGYSTIWNTGRWTGYIKMTDDFGAIRSELNGATNLSGKIYIQRKTSSGNSVDSKLCLYGSDGTTITTNTNIDRGEGLWVSLSSSVISKIQSGAIKFFYLKADSNNTSTYFKCESNAKIEITYTK